MRNKKPPAIIKIVAGFCSGFFFFAQQQAIGADTTALTALKAQLESALSGTALRQTPKRLPQQRRILKITGTR